MLVLISLKLDGSTQPSMPEPSKTLSPAAAEVILTAIVIPASVVTPHGFFSHHLPEPLQPLPHSFSVYTAVKAGEHHPKSRDSNPEGTEHWNQGLSERVPSSERTPSMLAVPVSCTWLSWSQSSCYPLQPRDTNTYSRLLKRFY